MLRSTLSSLTISALGGWVWVGVVGEWDWGGGGVIGVNRAAWVGIGAEETTYFSF